MRIVNKKRFIISLSLIFIFCFFLFNFMTHKSFSYTEPKYSTITISQGDTLWKIAKRGEGSVEKNIDQIKKINHLSSSNLSVGQELILPFEY